MIKIYLKSRTNAALLPELDAIQLLLPKRELRGIRPALQAPVKRQEESLPTGSIPADQPNRSGQLRANERAHREQRRRHEALLRGFLEENERRYPRPPVQGHRPDHQQVF